MEEGEALDDGPGGLKGLQRSEEVFLWMLEHLWVHHREEIPQVVGAPSWPQMDLHAVNLEERWRLRASSAQVYFIMRSRKVEHFEKVVKFLEDTFSLLPNLVPALKHMKILFGLKTLVIMRMFREGRGMIETVSKINQYFPNKLPQYQDYCTQGEMFLMRKNHQDFKDLAQSLALNKERLGDYIQTDMEDQYGERYAQKVEERLLLYLSQLDAFGPADTHVDKILKKPNPLNEEEKLLLDVMKCESNMRLVALRKLLHYVALHHSPRISPRPDHVEKLSEESQRPTTCQEGETNGGDEEADPDVPTDCLCLLVSDSKVRGRLDPVEAGEVVEERHIKEDETPSSSGSVREASPHFCSKHRRWVRCLLQECPQDSMQDDDTLSPPLYLTSSSSSQDLTPSNLISSGSTENAPLMLSGGLLISEPEHQEDKLNCGPSTTPQPSTSRNCLLSPVVRLLDIAPFLPFNPHQTSPESFHKCKSHQELSVFSLSQTQGSKDSTLSGNSKSNQATKKSQNASISQRPLTRRTSSRLLAKFINVCTTPGADDLSGSINCVSNSSADLTSSSSSSTSQMSTTQPSPQQTVHQNPVTSQPENHKNSHIQRTTLLRSGTASSAFIPDCRAFRSRTFRVLRPRMRFSHQTQAVLMQSQFLQPYVSLSRLSSADCQPGRSSTSSTEEEEEGQDSSFDMNELYSDSSTSSAEDDVKLDPHYKPKIKKRRLQLEYDNARGLNCT